MEYYLSNFSEKGVASLVKIQFKNESEIKKRFPNFKQGLDLQSLYNFLKVYTINFTEKKDDALFIDSLVKQLIENDDNDLNKARARIYAVENTEDIREALDTLDALEQLQKL
ncbi:MAG: hypothetical protein AAGG68_03140 [Bacteroidota bacterium]